MKIEKNLFGKLADNQEVDLIELRNDREITAKLIPFGATLISLQTPDKNGKSDSIVLGYDTLDEYVKDIAFLGMSIGRFANRIKKGQFRLNDKMFQLACNDNGINHLHGGPNGFHKVLWSYTTQEDENAVGVHFSYISNDGEEGYPGTLTTTISYTLNNENELIIEYTATTDAPTIINLTNHSYWNLSGAGSGTILNHKLNLTASKVLAVDDTLIPDGNFAAVKNSALDFNKCTAIGARISEIAGGYDHCYVLGEHDVAAYVEDPLSGRALEIKTDQPGIQFYSGNFLDGIKGAGGKTYNKHDAFCLEAQNFPDAINHSNFPDCILNPGEIYRQKTIHRFFIAT
jgi:aldose 1-epimerase